MTNTLNEPIAEQQELPFVGVENDEDILWRVTVKRPNVNRECFWGEPMGKNLFRLTQAPALQPDIFMDDIVEALPMEGEPHPVFTRVIKPSGNRSVALLTDSAWSSPAMKPFVADIRGSGVDLVLFTDTLAIATIPPHVDWDSIVGELQKKGAPITQNAVSGDLIKYLIKPCKCGRCTDDPKDMVLYHP
jgi:hypothetical protein